MKKVNRVSNKKEEVTPPKEKILAYVTKKKYLEEWEIFGQINNCM